MKVHIFYNCLLAALKLVLYRVGYDAAWTEVSANCDERKIPPFSGIPTELSELQSVSSLIEIYEGWNFNSGNYLFTNDTK